MELMGGGERAVCVTVGGTRKIVAGIRWSTTAQDIIQRLKPRSAHPLLLESWRGCVRPIMKDEYVCQVLEEWGDEAPHVQLVLVGANSVDGSTTKLRIYKAQTHGKVSINKKRCLSRLSTSKKDMIHKTRKLIDRLKINRKKLATVHSLTTVATNSIEVSLFKKNGYIN